MIDARVDDAIKQHLQKMDWLHGEAEAQTKTLTPPPAGKTAGGDKMDFTLPLREAPQAKKVITPVFEMNTKQEASPAGQDCEGAVKAQLDKEDKTGSSPPKDGTPV